MSISQVETSLNKQATALANKQLSYIKEAANVLVMDKAMMSDSSVLKQVCSNLNVLQIKRI